MFCINCFHANTQVTNSRAKKKQPIVWRRRRCVHCDNVFTTTERPSLSDNQLIQVSSGKTEAFNLGRLIISIASAFSHAPEIGKEQAFWLAQTVADTLSAQRENITPEDIAATTHQILKRFDELAALQYGAQRHLITSTRRRGRPSLREHGQPTDA